MKGKLLFWQFWAKKRPKFGRLAKHHFDFLCWLKGVILSYPLCTFFVRNPIPGFRRDLRPQNGYAALFWGIPLCGVTISLENLFQVDIRLHLYCNHNQDIFVERQNLEF